MRRRSATTSTIPSIILVLSSITLCSCSPYNPSSPVITGPASSPVTAGPARSPVITSAESSPVTTSPPPSPTEAPPAATWGNLGPANIGDSIEAVSAKLGLGFGPVEWLNAAGDCGITEAEGFDLALVVANPGGVQSFVVADPRIPLVTGNQPIHVGDSLSEAAAAFPNWFTTDSYNSLAGGPRGVVVPQELNQPGWGSRGRAALLEAGPDETIEQYRIGVSAYTLHVDYCTTPE